MPCRPAAGGPRLSRAPPSRRFAEDCAADNPVGRDWSSRLGIRVTRTLSAVNRPVDFSRQPHRGLRMCAKSSWNEPTSFFLSFPLGLNYKKLTDENMNPLEALEPVLSSQNILSISKLVPKIPAQDGRMLSPSALYTIWLQKLFWTGDPHLIKQVPESSPEWLRAYDVCVKYFDRLHPGDLITVVDAITFSPKAVTKVTERIARSALAALEEMKIALRCGRLFLFTFSSWGILLCLTF